MIGTVNWFSDVKGFGFITCEDGCDIFVHYNDICMKGHRTLNQGQVVEFEVNQTRRGPRAINVVVVPLP